MIRAAGSPNPNFDSGDVVGGQASGPLPPKQTPQSLPSQGTDTVVIRNIVNAVTRYTPEQITNAVNNAVANFFGNGNRTSQPNRDSMADSTVQKWMKDQG